MIQRTDNRMLGRRTTTILGATTAHQKERSVRGCDTEAAAQCTLEGQAAKIRGGGVYCTKKEEEEEEKPLGWEAADQMVAEVSDQVKPRVGIQSCNSVQLLKRNNTSIQAPSANTVYSNYI